MSYLAFGGGNISPHSFNLGQAFQHPPTPFSWFSQVTAWARAIVHTSCQSLKADMCRSIYLKSFLWIGSSPESLANKFFHKIRPNSETKKFTIQKKSNHHLGHVKLIFWLTKKFTIQKKKKKKKNHHLGHVKLIFWLV